MEINFERALCDGPMTLITAACGASRRGIDKTPAPRVFPQYRRFRLTTPPSRLFLMPRGRFYLRRYFFLCFEGEAPVSAAAIAVPLGEPMPVQASQPVAAAKSPLLPCVISLNAA